MEPAHGHTREVDSKIYPKWDAKLLAEDLVLTFKNSLSDAVWGTSPGVRLRKAAKGWGL